MGMVCIRAARSSRMAAGTRKRRSRVAAGLSLAGLMRPANAAFAPEALVLPQKRRILGASDFAIVGDRGSSNGRDPETRGGATSERSLKPPSMA